MTPRGGLVRKSPGHAFPVGRGVVVAPVLWARVLALTKAANRPARRCQRAGIVRQGDRRPADYKKVATQQGTSPRLIEDRTNGHSGCSGPVAIPPRWENRPSQPPAHPHRHSRSLRCHRWSLPTARIVLRSSPPSAFHIACAAESTASACSRFIPPRCATTVDRAGRLKSTVLMFPRP